MSRALHPEEGLAVSSSSHQGAVNLLESWFLFNATKCPLGNWEGREVSLLGHPAAHKPKEHVSTRTHQMERYSPSETHRQSPAERQSRK